MERAAWTDERLDDLADSVRVGFQRVDGDIRELRGEMADMRGEMVRMHQAILGVGGGIIVGLAGVIAAVLVGG